MRHAASMASANTTTISVIDFRRHSMVLQWHALAGTWTPCDTPPPLVHGIALIRGLATEYLLVWPGGRLHLQVGASQYALSENSPRISCTRGLASFGFRRRFTVESSTGGVLYSYAIGPINTRISFAGWQTKLKIPIGARRVDGNGLKASPRRCCGRARTIGSAQRGSNPRVRARSDGATARNSKAPR